MEIEQTLASVGLTGKKATLYLASLEQGPSSVLALSKTTKLFRPALYKLLAELESDGLFVTTISGKRKLYTAIEPSRLLDLYKKRERALEQVLPQLTLLANQGYNKPLLEYYEGSEQLRSLYRSVLVEKPKEIFTYFPSRYMAELFSQTAMTEVIQERIKLGIKSRTLRASSGEVSFHGHEERKKALREVRYISEEAAPAMGVIIANNTVDLYAPIAENYGIRVKSDSFAHLMRQYLETLWQSGKNK
ncbi:MAG: helix-turn-helix domain-containing protein [bacterium]|nr:helix-turn-helix domain-containing protein [bacterium]